MNHARILEAYLARLSDKHIQQIAEARSYCAHAQLCYGNLEQLKAHTKLYKTIAAATHELIQHDLQIIENIVNLEATE
jgi:hypothetical protein